MTDLDGVTQWIEQLRQGDSVAAEKLWQTYFSKMVVLARHKLEGARRVAVDEEDVALSAFKSFCIAAQQGRYSQLVDRTNLWPLLVAVTANKSVDAIRYENRKKRGGSGGPVAGSAGQSEGAENQGGIRIGDAGLSELIAQEPSPEFAVLVADELEALLQRLERIGDEDLKQITIQKLAGSGNDEIAKSLGCARRTVERKLQIIARTIEKA